MEDLKRILIVEDSPTVIEMMKLMLKGQRVKVLTAGSEFGMFQSIESFGKVVDLVIMDITLKTENGLDLIEKIRANPRYSDIPVLVVTEHAQRDLILRAKALGVKSFIRKPITKDLFLSRIHHEINIDLDLPSNTSSNINSVDTVEVVTNENDDEKSNDK